ncbi:MAG TPA: hypothetical protein VMB71_13725 [Acetobacteraceae bacterium]|nr:hypothetical protein [Acetobacteraceae bacterium]
MLRFRALLLLAVLAGCGDLPRPFAGNPGPTALRLAHPPPARLTVPPPTAALLPADTAKQFSRALTDALVAEELPAFPEAAKPGDWQLRVTADLQGPEVRPTYTLLDGAAHNRGSFSGQPIPAGAWAAGDAGTLSSAATDAAPKVMSLLRSVEATMAQSDPNSLYNRPARIYFAGVTGAPGDGDMSLDAQMRRHLPETGDQLVTKPDEADFVLHGLVHVTDIAGSEQQVEIHWRVLDAYGKIAGDVAQGHDFPRGALNGFWGDIAVAVATEAAGGVHEVITNWSGRKK